MKKPKILLIESNEKNIELFRKALPSKIYNMKIHKVISTSLQTAKKWQPQIIIINSEMEYFNVYDLVIDIKAERGLLDTNIILITPKLKKEEYLRGLSLGVFKFLEKPFGENEIKVHVNFIVGIKEVQSKIVNEVFGYLKKSLVENIKQESKDYVTQRIRESYEKIPDTLKQLSKITEETSETAMRTMDLVDEISNLLGESRGVLKKFKSDYNKLYFDSKLDKLDIIFDKIDDFTFNIENLLQFQDITTQQINYTNSIILKIQNLLKELLSYYSEQVMIETQLQIQGTFDPEATIKHGKDRQEDIDKIIENFTK